MANVSAHYLPHSGGIETHINQISKRLDGQDYDVVVVTSRASRTTPARDVIDGTSVHRHRVAAPQLDYCMSPGIFWEALTGRWDLIHCQGAHTLSAPMALLAATISRTPCVVTFHTGGHSSPRRTGSRQLQWRILGPLLRRAEGLIAVCEFEREYFGELLGIPHDRFTLIRNGADLPEVGDDQPAPAKCEGELRILSIGRLERYKGHHLLIEALAAMDPSHRAQLFIVGSGPYEQNLRTLVHDRRLDNSVHFAHYGPEQRGGLAALIRSADVVGLMSEYEAHPVAVMEALGLGCPVVVAATSGMVELARMGWVTSVDLEAPATKVAETLIGAAAKGLPDVTLPTWDECAQQVDEVYRRVLSAR